MASIIPFVDQVEALNNIYQWIISLPDALLSLVISFIYLVTYPVIIVFNYAVTDMNYLWSIVVTGINNILGVPNLLYYSYYGILNVTLPDPWKMLLFMAISVNVYVRVYCWMKRIPVAGRIL